MAITAALVKELRDMTGAGMMDAKKALVETDGNIDKAVDLLREKGLAAAAKKAGRIAAEGVVQSYIHAGGRIGVLVEVNCETDFVAKTDDFQNLARDIAMQIAAVNPTLEKMVAGRIEKFYKENCLLEQVFIKDGDKTVTDVINESIAKIGENINVRRFVRYGLGEGIEKRQDDFVAEVMASVGK